MNQIFLIAKREFTSQVKNKTFIIMTILSPLLIILAGAGIMWMNNANNNQQNIAVVDESGLFYTSLLSTEKTTFSFYGSKDIQGIKDSLQDSKYLNALLIIPKKSTDFKNIETESKLITNGSLGLSQKNNIEKLISGTIESLKLEEAGITNDQLQSVKSSVALNVFNLKGGTEEKGTQIKMFLSIILTYVIFTFIMIYGVRVMRSVVEEKQNRVVEIIISSVKPFQLMMGKILGTTFAAITQFTIWIGMTLVFLISFPAMMSSKTPTNIGNTEELLAENSNMMLKLSETSEILLSLNYPLIIFIFIAFFILGYLFYSSVFAAIGSAVDNDTDTQQFSIYPIIPMTVAMYGSISTIENPNGPVSFWLSMIPFTSPISMIARAPFGVSWWEIAISLSVLFLSTLAMIFFASKIYKIGILMYGKKPSLKEIWMWLRHSE